MGLNTAFKKKPKQNFLKKAKAQTQGPKTENGVKPYTKPRISNYFGQFR